MGSKEYSHDNAPAKAVKLLVQGRAHPLARNLGRTSTPPVVATAEWVHWYGHHPAPFRYRYAHPAEHEAAWAPDTHRQEQPQPTRSCCESTARHPRGRRVGRAFVPFTPRMRDIPYEHEALTQGRARRPGISARIQTRSPPAPSQIGAPRRRGTLLRPGTSGRRRNLIRGSTPQWSGRHAPGTWPCPGLPARLPARPPAPRRGCSRLPPRGSPHQGTDPARDAVDAHRHSAVDACDVGHGRDLYAMVRVGPVRVSGLYGFERKVSSP